MLAYSSISQVGYIIIALGANTQLALAGCAFHLFNHAIFKSLLFINAACVQKQINTMDIDNMGGLSSKMPVTGTTSVIGFLSTAGVPPLAGFWSKFIIVVALVQSGHLFYAVIALLSSVLTLGYFLRLQHKVFFGKLASGLENIREAPFSLVFAELLLAVITVGVGLSVPFVMSNFILPVKNILL